MTAWLAMLILFLLALAIMGAIGDSIDRRDAKRRNHVRRRR